MASAKTLFYAHNLEKHLSLCDSSPERDTDQMFLENPSSDIYTGVTRGQHSRVNNSDVFDGRAGPEKKKLDAPADDDDTINNNKNGPSRSALSYLL
ncbi:hypothetical protein DAPPUDRAFT_240802 [Daphnia pulex]|uniref:Uncharacterized protein n=1 Tax=Daphnia pulex TaxID=6669 RepID=E9GCL5_DAPPU|nr:hypothetical protein DAPPUDRAFT_240802 [Daphnia pulex]|eukprot:EFX82579.1 hypothetical protein DAPPUDRAFT_240802 [Daphnia pulex]